MRYAALRQRHHCVRVGMVALIFATLAVIALGRPARAQAFPTTTITGVPEGWSATDVTFDFVVDRTYSDSMVETKYWLPYPSGSETDFIGPVTVSAEGTSVVRFWSKDSHTDHENYQFAYIRIDKSAPVSTIDGIGDDPDSPRTVDFSITAADAFSGVAATYYRVDGGPQVLCSGTMSLPVTRTTSIDYWSVDVAGNTEATKSAVIWVDDGLPHTTISGVPASWVSSPVTFALLGTSPAGPVTTYWRLNGGSSAVYSSPVTVSSEGLTTVTFFSVDALGAREATRSASIMIDRTAPVSSVSGVPAGWSRTAAHLTVTASDQLSGVAGIRYRAGGDWVSGPSPLAFDVVAQGTTPIECCAFDAAGNTEAVHSGSVSVDSVKPTTTAVGLPASAVPGPVTFTLAASDPAPGSGVAATYYALDFGAAQPYAGPVTITKSGATTVAFWSVDVAGNTESPTYATVQITPAVDPAPVTSAALVPSTPNGANGWYTTTPVLTVTRDIAGTTYFRPTTDVLYATSTQSAFSPQIAQGEASYLYFGVSSTGVTETPAHWLVVKVDSLAPITSSDALATYSGAAAISLSASDGAAGSGVAHTYYRLDAGAQTDGTTIVTAVAGSHSIEYWSVDAAGNAESHHGASFTVAPGPDHTAPITSSDAVAVYTGSATIHLFASDDVGGSGVAHTYHVLDGGGVAEGTTIVVGGLGPHTLEYWSVDVAGNAEGHHSAGFTVAAVTHTVMASAGAGGSISPAGPQTVAHGTDSPTFTIAPSVGYRVANVYVDGVAIGAVGAYRLTGVTTDRTIAAVFARVTHTITASAGTGGSISPAGAQTVAYGDDSPTFTITPSEGFHVASVTVDGASVGIVGAYRFAGVTSDHTLRADFAADDGGVSTLTIAASRTRVPLGGTFVLSGAASPDPGMVGATVHVDVKKPGRTYWSYSSARLVYSNAGRASWWYRYLMKPGMAKGVYRFRVAYDRAKYLASESSTVLVTVR